MTSHCTSTLMTASCTSTFRSPMPSLQLLDSQCIADVEWWSASRLHLSRAKTLVMWLGSRQQVEKFTIRNIAIVSSLTTAVDTARDLGTIVDSQRTMSAHVGAVCHTAALTCQTSTVAQSHKDSCSCIHLITTELV